MRLDVTQGRIFREAFIQKLALLLRGTVAAPPERFGETLADEHIRGGDRPAPYPTPQLSMRLRSPNHCKALDALPGLQMRPKARCLGTELAPRERCRIATEI